MSRLTYRLVHLTIGIILMAVFMICVSHPRPAHAQTAGQYVDQATGNTRASQGVTVNLGATWTYSPPTGGYLNSTTAVPIAAARGGLVSNLITGGECYAEAVTTPTELVLLDGASIVWRMKVPVGGWPNPQDFNFFPYIKGTANTALSMQGLTATGTGAIYCNWRGGTTQ